MGVGRQGFGGKRLVVADRKKKNKRKKGNRNNQHFITTAGRNALSIPFFVSFWLSIDFDRRKIMAYKTPSQNADCTLVVGVQGTVLHPFAIKRASECVCFVSWWKIFPPFTPLTVHHFWSDPFWGFFWG